MDPLLFIIRHSPRFDWEWRLDSKSTEWNRTNALSMANCSLLAYNDPDVISSQLINRNFTEVVHCHSDLHMADKQDYVAVRPDAVVMAFRGTEPLNTQDFITDFNADQVFFQDKFKLPGSDSWGKIHAGWADGLIPVLPKLLDKLKEFDDDQRTLWITGHSLGGALATVMAAVIANLPNHPIQGVYTFGQPRVGDQTFCERYDKLLKYRTYRCVNNHDLVPHVPPREFTRLEQHVADIGDLTRIQHLAEAIQHREEILCYEHIGQLRLLLPDGTFSDNPSDEEAREPEFLKKTPNDRSLILDLPRLLMQFPSLIKDHAPINPFTHDGYIERLEALKNAD